MHHYLFELGHQPHISVAEIDSVLTTLQVGYARISSSPHLELTTDTALDIDQLQDILGGTIAIREKLTQSPTETGIASHLITVTPEGKIHFSVSGPNAQKIALAVKKNLKNHGRSVRYVEAKNTATILYNGLVEKQTDLLIYNKSLWVTRGIQQFDKFKERDFDRPAIDTKSGMLPPKLARILVNLSGADDSSTLYDPFCGSGTVLVEGLSLGIPTLYGSDISDKAVEDTMQNIAWYKTHYPEFSDTSITTHVHDSSRTISFIPRGAVTSVATEPYMGKPLHGNERKEILYAQSQELKTLYTKTFASLFPILSTGATVIFIIPSFKYQDTWINIDCIDDIKKQGYSVEPFSKDSSYLRYHRENQHLARDIWRFKKVS